MYFTPSSIRNIYCAYFLQSLVSFPDMQTPHLSAKFAVLNMPFSHLFQVRRVLVLKTSLHAWFSKVEMTWCCQGNLAGAQS